MGWRFSTVRDESGNWAVQDNERPTTLSDKPVPRTVCTCTAKEEADAIAAFMNGDLEGGRRLHQEFLSRLTSYVKS